MLCLRQQSLLMAAETTLEAFWSPEAMAHCIITVAGRLEQTATLVHDI